MHIGFDLDGTLVNWAVNPEAVAGHNLGIKQCKRFGFNFEGLDERLRQEIFRLLCDYEFTSMNNLKYDWLDRFALKQWKERGYTLSIITARDKSPEMKAEAKKVVDEWFPEIDNLVITKHSVDKFPYFKSMNIDYWVDDHPDVTLKAQEMGLRAYLVSHPYNWGYYEKELERVKRVYDLFGKGLIV